MYIEKTTIKERAAISNAMTPIFVNLERAESLLDTVQNECFECKRDSVFLSTDAKWVQNMVGIVENILFDAITAFHLTATNTFDNGAKYYLKDAKYAETAMRCAETLDRIHDIERSLPAERRKSIAEIRESVVDMDDEAALPILEALLKEQEAHNG